jgi:hypothetical protein
MTGEKYRYARRRVRGRMVALPHRDAQPMMNARQRDEEEDRFTASLAGLAMTLVLSIISLVVIENLAALSKLDDCLLQGRKNCERIELSPVRNEGLPLPTGVRRTATAWSGQFSDVMR